MHIQEKKFHFTMDVDFVRGTETGLAGLYDFCDRLELQATFFFTGKFAVEYGELVKEAAMRGFELGTHGWLHGQDPDEDFSRAGYEDQKRWIVQSTEAVENAAGTRPRLFRAPNLFVSATTHRVLRENYYTLDSSVPARRPDFKRWRNYYGAPLHPYFPDPENPGAPGGSGLCEIPPSAYFMPLNMSAMRVFGERVSQWAIKQVFKQTNAFVFYGHPSEVTDPDLVQFPGPVPKRHREGTGPQNFAYLEKLVDFLRAQNSVSAFMESSIPR